MRATLLLAGLVLIAAPANATQDPVPSKNDPRVGYFTYVQDDVFRIWSTPEASFLIKLNEGETIDAVTGADVCKKDAKDDDPCGIVAGPRFNWLHLKFKKCLIPEMLLVVTKAASGKMRMYNFEVHTEPVTCSATAEKSVPRNDGLRLVSAANAAEVPAGASNLRYVSGDALTRTAALPIFFSAAFKYPGDEAEKVRESGRDRRERQKKEQIDYLLAREIDALTRDPWSGTGNDAYRWRGSTELLPYQVRDNGRSTGMAFAVQHAPVAYRVIAPDGYQCRDDEPAPPGEQQAQYSPVLRGNALIFTGTAKIWRLRDSEGRVADICNLNYSPYLAPSPTGTDSPNVLRVVKEAQ